MHYFLYNKYDTWIVVDKSKSFGKYMFHIYSIFYQNTHLDLVELIIVIDSASKYFKTLPSIANYHLKLKLQIWTLA